MLQPCTVTNCQSAARTLCYGCNENFCRQHMIEHDFSLNSQLKPLAEQINSFDEKFQTIDFAAIRQDFAGKIEQWRIDSRRTIDEFCREKIDEFEQFLRKKFEEKTEEIQRIRLKMSELIREQEATHTEIDELKSIVSNLENQFERTSNFQFYFQTFKLETNLIEFEEKNSSNRFDLSSLSSIYKSINYSKENWAPIASNQQSLLVHQQANLCLFDRNLNLIKEISWPHGTIFDLNWSKTLNRFVILNANDVFLLDVPKMSIEHISSLPKRKWLSCTSSSTSLFLSTKVWGSSIYEYRLRPTIELVKQWQTPETCGQDEVINAIVYHENSLAMMIKNSVEKRIHFEMRSLTNLERLWSMKFSHRTSENIRTRCCLFNTDEWLVIDRNQSKIFYVSNNGKLKGSTIYNPPAFSALVFAPDLLVVSTARGLNLHKLNFFFS